MAWILPPSRGGPRYPLRDKQAPWFLSECGGGLPFSDGDFGNPRVIFLDEDDRREVQGILSVGGVFATDGPRAEPALAIESMLRGR